MCYENGETTSAFRLAGAADSAVCLPKQAQGRTNGYVSSGVIAIAADESFQPIVQEEIDVFEGLFPLAGIVPRYVTEVDAVNLLLRTVCGWQ